MGQVQFELHTAWLVPWATLAFAASATSCTRVAPGVMLLAGAQPSRERIALLGVTELVLAGSPPRDPRAAADRLSALADRWSVQPGTASD
jgi:hypothetical protein